MRPDVRYRLAGLAILVVVAILVAVFLDVPNVADLRREYAGTGLFGALGFALVYALLSLLPLPATVFTLAAGAVFGLARGLPIVVLGAILGAMAAFYLGRVLGRDAVQHFTGARLQTLDRYLERRGFWAVLAARLVPIVPFSAFNYLSGLTAVRAPSYLFATMLGILPGTTAYVAVGAYGDQPGSLPFITALGALLLLTVGGVSVARHRRHRAPETTADTQSAAPHQPP
ncbi:MAG: TVP38/TMEM64 family protein [Pseudonocardiales bacterium]|nr:MAG: TVP38/TMEM64 family protein [Pseudonocardiales bacterium]